MRSARTSQQKAKRVMNGDWSQENKATSELADKVLSSQNTYTPLHPPVPYLKAEPPIYLSQAKTAVGGPQIPVKQIDGKLNGKVSGVDFDLSDKRIKLCPSYLNGLIYIGQQLGLENTRM